MFTTTITTDLLANDIHNSSFRIIDCRFDLQNPQWGYQEYLNGHIPGAMYASLNSDLSAPVTSSTGRHPLPQADIFAKTMTRLGIDNSSQVIAYDSANGAYASRLWWMLHHFGHKQVAVLEGGYSKWLCESKAIQQGSAFNSPGDFNIYGEVRSDDIASTDEIIDNLRSQKFLLIDVRSPERFQGETETIDAVAGHIPGAVNRFYGENQESDGTFKSQQTLRNELMAFIGNYSPENTVIYCGSGVTSCVQLLALEIAGLHGSRLYPGSWSEWIRDPARPIARTS